MKQLMGKPQKKTTPRREVSDEEMWLALKNSDNEKVIWRELGRYKGLISGEELKRCGMQALWRALQYHRKGFRQKFTTSLYRFVHWECRRELRKQASERKNFVSLESLGDIPVKDKSERAEHRERMVHLRDCMEYLSSEQKKLLIEYYVEQWTYDEIAAIHQWSKETVRGKLNTAVSRLRELCEEPEESVYSDPE